MNKNEQIRRRHTEDSGIEGKENFNFKPVNINNEQPAPEIHLSQDHYHIKIKCLVFLLVVLFFLFLLCLLFIFLAQSTPTYPLQYSLPEAPSLVNPLKLSDFNSSKLFHGKILGPEFLCLRNGLIYTGTMDGKVLEVDEKSKKIRVVAKLGKGQECGSYEHEEMCGRPLGMEFDTDGFLLVVDAYLGIFRVDVGTGLVQTVVSPSTTKTEPHNLKMTFLNDLEITDNGEIFFTDSSIFPRKDLLLDALMGTTNGKLLKYDPILNLVTIAAPNLAFPNGLLLSRFQDYIFIAETSRARITKYNIKGINAGVTEAWVENLPCLPDNLYHSTRGTIWVGCGYPRHQGVRFRLADVLGGMVWLRRLMQELPISCLWSILRQSSLLLELSEESGQILRTIIDNDGDLLQHTSHVVESVDGGKLYVGSYKADYIGVVEI